MEKKLYRSREHKMIAGVLGGLGEYFDTDPNFFRLVYVLLTVFTGVFPGIVAYLLAIFIIPSAPHVIHTEARPVEEHDSPAI